MRIRILVTIITKNSMKYKSSNIVFLFSSFKVERGLIKPEEFEAEIGHNVSNAFLFCQWSICTSIRKCIWNLEIHIVKKYLFSLHSIQILSMNQLKTITWLESPTYFWVLFSTMSYWTIMFLSYLSKERSLVDCKCKLNEFLVNSQSQAWI